MSRGRRYEEPKLNIKKVIAVILAVAVIAMSVFVIKGILAKQDKKGKITSESYFAAYKDNKWGVIDSNGKNVIDPSYTEMIIVPDSKTDIFLCTYDVNYDNGEYKTKALNSKNEEIFTEYQKIEAIPNSDENNNLWYEQNVLKIQKDGKYGIIKFNGKEILKPEYDSVTAVKGIKNAYLIQKNNKYGIVDNEGKIVLDTIYTEIVNLGKDNKAGYIVKDDKGLYGIVDYSKKKILENKYEKIEKVYGNDLYVVTTGGTKKVINKDEQEVLTQGFDEIASILKNRDQGVIFIKNQKYGVMSLSGEIKIVPEYDKIEEAKPGIFIVAKDGKTGVIDIDKNEKVPFHYISIIYNEPADIYIAENGDYNSNILDTNFEIKQTGILIDLNEDKGYLELRQNDEYKYYNFKFEEKNIKDILLQNTIYLSKKDGKYGFIDKAGNIVVDYIYDDATEQNEYGYAAIKKEGKWGSINSKGQVVIEPKYNLDDYLIVNFIADWHFGKDLNINYYEKGE